MPLGGAEVPGSAGVPRPQAQCRGQSVALHTGFGPAWSCCGDAGDKIGLVLGTSLAVQRSGPGTVTAGSPGSIPDRGPETPEVTWRGQKEHRWSLSQQSTPAGKAGAGNIAVLTDTHCRAQGVVGGLIYLTGFGDNIPGI